MTDYWRRKLAAYLHDPPSKFSDIGLHEDHARTLYRQAGFVLEDELQRLSDGYAKPSDWTASAADRFPFPKSRNNLQSVFDGKKARFHHPLSAGCQFEFHAEFTSAEAAMEVDQTVQPVSSEIPGWSPADQWRARFFTHWRLWEKFCTERDCRFGFLPADTRIPDHTVWTHMQVVSALDACADGSGKDAVLRPAFLKFQIGPVQDFIAEARSVRDLWSGSYLLSWLMATGLKSLAWNVGPDAVIFPNLKGQPLFDLHLRDDLWSQVKVNGKSVWEHLAHDNDTLLTPNLPNIFLAVVREERAEELGKLVADAIRREWENIAASVWKFCEKAELILNEEARFSVKARKERFDREVSQLLSVSWQAMPLPKTLGEAMNLRDPFDGEMPIGRAAQRVQAIIDYATATMPEADRDGRYYVGGDNGPKTELNNIGLGWSVVLALNGWQLDAVRQTRAFGAWSTGRWDTGAFCQKDSLNGRAEAVAGGRNWKDRAQKKGGLWASLFKHEDWLGASTLIKRLWHIAYLKEKWKLKTESGEFPMPNTRGIAAHKPFSSGDDEDVERISGEKYFAVLALDGDEIGKWVSGEKTPQFGEQFSYYFDSSHAQRQGARKYFQDHAGAALLSTPRALSPSYHLQFSQALSNFALQCARRIVEAFDGRLIYAGGDDVLSMLPADNALECAQALRLAFQGYAVTEAEIQSPSVGFLSIGKLDQAGRPIVFPVPGFKAEVSVGIAVAHFKSPLQDVVREALAAQKRAKRELGRAALSVTLLKRSGEILKWGAQWESGGLELYQKLARALEKGDLKGKFPHRVCELLSGYLTTSNALTQVNDADGFHAVEIIKREFAFAATRQGSDAIAAALAQPLATYLERLTQARAKGEEEAKASKLTLHQELLEAVIGLCQTVAFADRNRSGDIIQTEAQFVP